MGDAGLVIDDYDDHPWTRVELERGNTVVNDRAFFRPSSRSTRAQ